MYIRKRPAVVPVSCIWYVCAALKAVIVTGRVPCAESDACEDMLISTSRDGGPKNLAPFGSALVVIVVPYAKGQSEPAAK